MKRLYLYLALLAIVLALTAAVPGWATTHTVSVANFSFTPANLTINQGDTVVWNCTQGTHNVHHTATPSLFGNELTAAPWTYTFAFTAATGTFPYVCQLHAPGMAGSIVVVPATSAPEPPSVVNAVELEQNYPNPFNSETVIRFALPMSENVHLTILNVLGQKVSEVFNGRLAAGNHQVLFDAEGLPSGLYYYRLETPQATLARKMYLLR